MDLEKFFELLLSNPNNVHLEYSNINGQESLRINGEELFGTPDKEKEEKEEEKEEEEKEVYNDTAIKEYISNYKDNIQLLDDCTFVEVIEQVENVIDIQALDELLSQESFTQDEAELIYEQLNFINTVIHEKLVNKIQDLQELIDRL